jgi:hypothetical protein
MSASGRSRPKSEPQPFTRLIDRAVSGSSPTSHEAAVGALIDRAGDPAGLDGAALVRIWMRLGGGRARTAGDEPRDNLRPRPTRGRAWSQARGLAAAVVLLLVSGAVVGAKTGTWTWPRDAVERFNAGFVARFRPHPAGPARVPAPVSVRRMRGPAPGAVALRAPTVTGLGATPPGLPSATEPKQPPEAPAPGERHVVKASAAPGPPQLTVASGAHRTRHPSPLDPLPLAAKTTTTATAPPPLPTGAAEPAADRLADETRLLGQVLAELRRGGDPRRALVGLDTYAARFPDGLLAGEAARARVDALWLAGRLTETRAALATLALGPGARDRELRLIRAELDARTDCRGALADFAVVASEARDGPLAERAAWGQAACRDRLGDAAGARAALSDYLRRFPDGAHSAAARARLGK